MGNRSIISPAETQGSGWDGQDFDVRTAVATAIGCPYGRLAEQAVQANVWFAESQRASDPAAMDVDAYEAGIEVADTADDDANDIAAALLSCKTCGGDPRGVDFADKVCEYALRASMHDVVTPDIIREYQKSRTDLGS